MLRENPQKRPNIYEVVREVCHMQGKEVPIRDVRRIFELPLCVLLLILDRSTLIERLPRHERIKSCRQLQLMLLR